MERQRIVDEMANNEQFLGGILQLNDIHTRQVEKQKMVTKPLDEYIKHFSEAADYANIEGSKEPGKKNAMFSFIQNIQEKVQKEKIHFDLRDAIR